MLASVVVAVASSLDCVAVVDAILSLLSSVVILVASSLDCVVVVALGSSLASVVVAVVVVAAVVFLICGLYFFQD